MLQAMEAPLDAQQLAFIPPMPRTIEETGLNPAFLADLALKHIYYEGFVTALDVSKALKLPYKGITEMLLEGLKRDRMVEVKGAGSGGFGTSSYEYVITNKGNLRAREVLERSRYVGPAPVTLQRYVEAANLQALSDVRIGAKDVLDVFSDLVINKNIFEQIGPAVNSSRSIFLFGPPGNGKTTISERIGAMMLRGEIYIPYALEADGNVIKFFDPINHVPVETNEDIEGQNTRVDQRWLRIHRPAIMVGGELTMDMLELSYDPNVNYYEAPLQMKANGGMFLVDDFGRQQVRPQDLLNRWIVPLEKRVDFLKLQTGGNFEIPFDVLVVFATNIEPRELVDDAFLRRIRHKIDVKNPSLDEYRVIFQSVCETKGVAYNDQILAYLLKEYYMKPNRDLRACHPRDLIDQIIDISNFMDTPPKISKEMIDRACRSYFAVDTMAW